MQKFYHTMESIINRHARSDYDFLDTWEAGLVLTGAEVKSIKLGRVKLQGSYISIEAGRAWIKQMHIGPYQRANQPGYDPERVRPLLLTKKELLEMTGKSEGSGLTIVPIKVYSRNGFIKLSIALARGLKKYDKRQKIKKRDLDREAQALMKRTR
jgi:SsrA-binding protein